MREIWKLKKKMFLTHKKTRFIHQKQLETSANDQAIKRFVGLSLY